MTGRAPTEDARNDTGAEMAKGLGCEGNHGDLVLHAGLGMHACSFGVAEPHEQVLCVFGDGHAAGLVRLGGITRKLDVGRERDFVDKVVVLERKVGIVLNRCDVDLLKILKSNKRVSTIDRIVFALQKWGRAPESLTVAEKCRQSDKSV